MFSGDDDVASESSDDDESGSDCAYRAGLEIAQLTDLVGDDSSEGSGSFDDEEDEGEDWDELEKKAKRGEPGRSIKSWSPTDFGSRREAPRDQRRRF